MDAIDKVKEALLDKGFSETGAITQMWWRGLFPSLFIFNPSFIPIYADEEYVKKVRQEQIDREKQKRIKLAEEFLIEINYMRPQWNNSYAQY